MNNYIWEVEKKMNIPNKGVYIWGHVEFFNTRSDARKFIKNESRNIFRIIKKHFTNIEKKYVWKNLCLCGALYDRYCPNCGDDDYIKRVLSYQDEEGSWRIKGE